MSGTDLACYPTRVRYWPSVSPYARATRCPVLTYCITLRACYAMSGTDIAYQVLSDSLRHRDGTPISYALPMRCPVLT
eukprot:3940735-Rhodomonas_salina.5